jgi:cystathionine beta-lyase
MEAAYTHGFPWLQALLVYLEDNVALLRERLKDIPGVELNEPEGSFLLWTDFTGLRLAPDDLMAFLGNEAKWAVTRGHAFGDEGKGYARLNITCTSAKLDLAPSQLKQVILVKQAIT